MGYNVPCSHDEYAFWAVLRAPNLQAALSHEGDSASRNYPTHHLLLFLTRGKSLMNRLTESNQERPQHCQK